jgi:hypothetical protein
MCGAAGAAPYPFVSLSPGPRKVVHFLLRCEIIFKGPAKHRPCRERPHGRNVKS